MLKIKHTSLVLVTTAAIIAAATTGTLNILSVYADRDVKEKNYQSESGGGNGALCFKDPPVSTLPSCKGFNINQDVRQTCETFFGNCKQVHPRGEPID